MNKRRGIFAFMAIFMAGAAFIFEAAVFVPEEPAMALTSGRAEARYEPVAMLALGEAPLENPVEFTTASNELTEVLRAGMFAEVDALSQQVEALELMVSSRQAELSRVSADVREVPFFSQFADIASPTWQKVGCGIASVAMVIDYYDPGSAEVEALLAKGRSAGYFLPQAGWTHAGLISLARPFGLSGETHSLAHLGADGAFAALSEVLERGPVMASVHYTFEPTNPIPHLVVVNDVRDGLVYYNDPAEPTGGGSISIEKFQRAWKQRYIEIRPVS